MGSHNWEHSAALPLATWGHQSRQVLASLITRPALRTHNAPLYQISVQSDNPRFLLLWFKYFQFERCSPSSIWQKWILTIPRSSWLHPFTEFDSFAGRLCHRSWRQTYNVRKILSPSSSLPLLAIMHPAARSLCDSWASCEMCARHVDVFFIPESWVVSVAKILLASAFSFALHFCSNWEVTFHLLLRDCSAYYGTECITMCRILCSSELSLKILCYFCQ